MFSLGTECCVSDYEKWSQFDTSNNINETMTKLLIANNQVKWVN